MSKQLWAVALDEPYGDGEPHNHDRAAIYFVELDDADIARLQVDTAGRVTIWRPPAITYDYLLMAWREWQRRQAAQAKEQDNEFEGLDP